MTDLAVVTFAVSTTPSGNTLWNRYGTHMANRHRYKKIRDGYLIQVLAGVSGDRGWRTWPHDLKRTVTYERMNPTRQELDYDRLVQGITPLQDALTRTGLLVDDGPGYVTPTYLQRKAEKRALACTRVRVALTDEPARWTAAIVRKWCERVGLSVPAEVG